MAEKQAGGLSLRIGLTLSQLQSDFLTAEQTIKQGMAALNRQQNLIKLRMEADTAGLDQVKDASKILEIQERSLTQLIEMQRDRLTLASKAYQDYSSSKNANAAVSKNLETAVERERLALARLEAQLKNLSAQKVSIDTSGLQSNIDKITAKIQNVRLQAVVDTGKLQGANTAFDAQKIHIAAVTKELELQRQKLFQLQELMTQTAKATGADSLKSLNLKSNVLQQIQQINQLELKLKELQNTKVDLQIRADSMKQAEQIIQENIARINARLDNIRIKTDIDMSRLGAAVSEFNKAKLQVQALNRELDLEKQKLTELQKAMYTSASKNGINSSQTLSLRSEVLKQIQAIDQLKAKISELNKTQAPKTNNLLSSYLNIKGDVVGKLNEITSAFSNLQGATSSVDNAIMASLSVIGTIPHPVGKAVAALAAMPIVLRGVENSFVDMAKAAASAGDSIYVMSRGFQMSLADTGKFTAMCKTAGVEVNDLASTIKRTQQQIIRGGDSSKAEQWLKRYGESAFDANGHLKNLNDMTLTLSRALKKAQDEGNGMNFILATMRGASADAITAIEDAEDVYKQAATIVGNGLIDPKFAHEVQGNINAMNLQASKMNANFSAALLPVANEIVPRLTERMEKLTQIIADNKDMIRDFGRTAAEAFLKIEQAAETVGGTLAKVARAYYDWQKNPRQDEIIEKYKNATVESVDELIKREQPRAFNVIKDNPLLYQQVKSIYEPIFKALKDVQDEIKRKNEELKKELEKQLTSVADISSAASDRLKVEQNPELLKEAESVKKILQEASDIQYKLSHTDYENKKLDILQWQQDMLNQAEITEEKRIAIEKLGGAKLAQLEKEQREKIAKDYEETNKKIREHAQNAADIEYELTHSAFEKQIRDIEQWEEAMRDKADTAEEIAGIVAEAAAKEAQAFEREMDRIKGKLQSLDDKIFEIDHSQYENDLRRIQQEYLKQVEEYQAAGMLTPEVKAKLDYLLNRQTQKLNARAKDGGDYIKAPEGAMKRGGNGISVIEGDQIVDDGLKTIAQGIGLLTNENQIRQQLLPQLSREAQERVSAIQMLRNSTDAQRELAQATTQSGYQIIEGDQVVNNPSGYQVIEGDEVVSGLQQFSSAFQSVASQIEELNQPISEVEKFSAAMAQSESDFQETLKRMAESLPVNYFKTLADNAKAVSDMQFGLTESTMKLIDAQEQLREALNNLPKFDSMIPTSNQQSANGLMNLSTQRQVSDIPQQPVQQNSGMKFGFDWDVFGGLAGLAALIPHPAAKVLALGGALGAGAGVGTYNETNAQSTPMTFETIVTPINNIHTVVSNILSALDNRQPAQITVSPTNQINLGGAYVFDNAMKKQLVDDITTDIVDEITQAMTQATSRASYSYGV